MSDFSDALQKEVEKAHPSKHVEVLVKYLIELEKRVKFVEPLIVHPDHDEWNNSQAYLNESKSY